ncbi:MAG: hypothetical protein U0Q11_14035 [Vicinamibacterales bacterium]
MTAAATSADTNYNGLSHPTRQRVTNTDNDTAGFSVVTPTSGLTTTEGGGTATFTIVLDVAADGERDGGSHQLEHRRGHGLAASA